MTNPDGSSTTWGYLVVTFALVALICIALVAGGGSR